MFPSSLLRYLLPRRCASCRTHIPESAALCGQCRSRCAPIVAPYCDRCGHPFDVVSHGAIDDVHLCGQCLSAPPAYDHARACMYYDGIVKNLLMRFKHGDATHLAPLFSRWMLQTCAPTYYQDVDLILPVPIHPLRLMKRQYNQSLLLARPIARAFGLPLAVDWVKKVKNSASQGRKNAQQRAANVKNTLQIDEKKQKKLNKKVIMIIDDVYTTGATVNELSKVLVSSGASVVKVHTFARVTRTQGV